MTPVSERTTLRMRRTRSRSLTTGARIWSWTTISVSVRLRNSRLVTADGRSSVQPGPEAVEDPLGRRGRLGLHAVLEEARPRHGPALELEAVLARLELPLLLRGERDGRKNHRERHARSNPSTHGCTIMNSPRARQGRRRLISPSFPSPSPPPSPPPSAHLPSRHTSFPPAATATASGRGAGTRLVVPHVRAGLPLDPGDADGLPRRTRSPCGAGVRRTWSRISRERGSSSPRPRTAIGRGGWPSWSREPRKRGASSTRSAASSRGSRAHRSRGRAPARQARAHRGVARRGRGGSSRDRRPHAPQPEAGPGAAAARRRAPPRGGAVPHAAGTGPTFAPRPSSPAVSQVGVPTPALGRGRRALDGKGDARHRAGTSGRLDVPDRGDAGREPDRGRRGGRIRVDCGGTSFHDSEDELEGMSMTGGAVLEEAGEREGTSRYQLRLRGQGDADGEADGDLARHRVGDGGRLERQACPPSASSCPSRA